MDPRAAHDLDLAQEAANLALEAPVVLEVPVVPDLVQLDDRALDQAVETDDDPNLTLEREAVIIAEVAPDLAPDLDKFRRKTATLDRIRNIFPLINLFSSCLCHIHSFVAPCFAT